MKYLEVRPNFSEGTPVLSTVARGSIRPPRVPTPLLPSNKKGEEPEI